MVTLGLTYVIETIRDTVIVPWRVNVYTNCDGHTNINLLDNGLLRKTLSSPKTATKQETIAKIRELLKEL
jgi:hypothetical protein